MRAAYFQEHGGIEVLQVGDLPEPERPPGWLRIEVKACALNRLDLFVREGWPGLKLPLPHIGGTDVAGVVRESDDPSDVGREVIVNPGLNFEADEDGEQIVPDHPSIIGETRWGGLAESVLVPADRVHAKPPELSWDEAAALPLTLQTAMQMLRKARVGAGDKVLVVGGGGGVSVMAIQIAKALGAWVCATTSRAKREQVQGLGADEVIDYANEAWPKAAFAATGKSGFDVVVDAVGAATWHHSVRALRNGGRLVTCGATSGPKGEMDIRNVFWKQLTILGSTMGTPADLQRALDLVAGGKVRAVVDSVYALEDVAEAHERLASGDVFGKVVVRP